MQSIKQRSFKRISTTILAILLVLALFPANVDAKVNPFRDMPPGGAGTGGGAAEAAPRGFGIDTNGAESGGLVWLSSEYDNYNWCAIFTGITNGLQEEIPAVDENGDPIIYYLNAYVDRNPGNIAGNTDENPEPFIILYKDGERVSLAGTIDDNGTTVQKVGTPIRGQADRTGNTEDPSGQTGRWTIPMTLTFEPGHTYEFAFAQGFICNNGVANMISEDGTGYYQNISADPADPERIYYEANKYNESQYREYLYQTYKSSDTPGAKEVYLDEEYKNPNVGTLHPMRFTLKTEALPPVAVTGVTLEKTETTVAEGDTEQLTATVEPADAADNSVSWSSSDESVAIVSDDGTVTGVAPGKATITVTTTDGTFTDECIVTVPGLVLTSTVATMTEGDTTLVTADYFGPQTELFWSSDDSTVVSITNATNAAIKAADISTAAELTAESAGNATISVETADGIMVASFEVTVEAGEVIVDPPVDPTDPIVGPTDPGTAKPTDPSKAGTVTKTAAKSSEPKTGDNSLTASALMLLLAAGATGAGALKRRREH